MSHRSSGCIRQRKRSCGHWQLTELRPVDPENPVRVYAKTKLVISHHVGGRAHEDAVELLTDTENRRDKSTELPISTSDDWDAYKNALLYGVEEQPEYEGREDHPIQRKCHRRT